MNKDSILRFAGEVNVKNVTLYSLNGTKLNISNQITSIEIYEDIFSPFITATIIVAESVDFINLFPFIGEEYIEVNIETPTSDVPIKNVFYVYKISDRIYTSDREVTYAIKCVSKEFVRDANLKLRKAISGNIEKAAKSLIKEEGLGTDKSILSEPTTNNIKFVSNFWSPVKCLNYLASSAISSESSPSFLFFENRNGFNFVSINTLFESDVYQVFTKDNYARDLSSDQSSASSNKNVVRDYTKILELNIPIVTDYMKSTQSGQVSSKVISHDILTKRYRVKDYSLLNDQKVFRLLNDKLPHSDKVLIDNSSMITVIPKYYNTHMGFADSTDYKTFQRRQAFFENLRKHTIRINVLGRTDYTVGLLVDVTIPSVKEFTEQDPSTKDKMLSGKYIITAISHKIDHENHECNIELMKNSVIN